MEINQSNEIHIQLPPLSRVERIRFFLFDLKVKTKLSLSYVIKKLSNKPLTYNGWIPSKNMSSELYNLYMEMATPEELKHDVVSETTMWKIVRAQVNSSG